MDEIYVIYRNGKMVEKSTNGYSTKRGAKAAITSMAKNDLKDKGLWIENVAEATDENLQRLDNERQKYEIRTFIPTNDLNILELIKIYYRR